MSGTIRVLVVDGDRATVEAVESTLRSAGLDPELRHATDRASFLGALTDHQPELIVTDHEVDGLGCVELLGEVCRLEWEPEVIVLATEATLDTAVASFRAGAADYVKKERIEELGEAAVAALRRRDRRHTSLRDEEDLRRNERRLREFFEGGLTGNFLSTVDGRLLECNATFADIFGLASKEEALQVPMESLHESPDARARLLDRLRSAGALEGVETSVVRPDGRSMKLITSLHGRFDEAGELTHIRGQVLDVTRIIELEHQLRQAQKMEAVGRLAGGVAHDFNNLLAVILSYASFVREAVSTQPDVVEDVEQIVQAAERAARLTDQLLAFSRRRISNPQPLDLREVVRGVEKMLDRMIGEDVVLEVRVTEALPPVRADRAQIEQVLMNLAVNARDAMPDGGTLTVAADPVTLGPDEVADRIGLDPGSYVVVEVADTGVGMDEETVSHIWEPFFTTKGQGKGTGLGLATAYAVVEQLGGTIEVKSEPGRGTTFSILLPALDEKEVAAAGDGAVAEPGLGGGETILVVEDEPGVREISRRILAGAGYRVLAASNAGEALLLCERHGGPVHLLLSDVVMPHMSGPELARRAAALRPGMRIVFMTGYAGEAASKAVEAGHGTPVLLKPFTKAQLLEAVQAALSDSGEHSRLG